MNDLSSILKPLEIQGLQASAENVVRLAKLHGRDDPNPYSTNAGRLRWEHGFSGQEWETISPAFGGLVGSPNWMQFALGRLCREAQNELYVEAAEASPRPA